MSDKAIIGGVVVLLMVVGGVLFMTSSGENYTTPVLDASAPVAQFAQCLKDSGAIFYGAFWCPHCQAQKKLFAGADDLLPYVECSTPNGQGQLPVCQSKNVQSYPTWDFADGSRLTGELSFAQLSEKSGCPVPGAEGAVPTSSTMPADGENVPEMIVVPEGTGVEAI